MKLKHISFWYYQIVGWSIFYLVDLIIFMIVLRKQTFMGIIAETICDVLFFLITLQLRVIYRNIDYRTVSVRGLVTNVLVWSTVTAVIWQASMNITMSIFEKSGSVIMYYELRWIIANIIFLYFPIALCWSALYFGIKFWLDFKQEKERTDQAKLLAQRAKLMMLRYQLNPHFLFNALNSIRALIEEDARTAKIIITELFEFLQYSFTSEHKSIITLRDELTILKYYLSIEKKRYEDKLDILWDIDPDTEDFKVLNFLIHPLVENAIKHGMQTSTIPLRIRISANRINGALRISITNSGKWIVKNNNQADSNNGTGTGLENVRARLENTFPGRYRLEMFEKDGYVYVILTIGEIVNQGNEKNI